MRISASECHKTNLRPDFDEILTQPALTLLHTEEELLREIHFIFLFLRVQDIFVWQVCVLLLG